ncbi:glycosyltransferase family 2 protein [Paenibacillus sp. 1001270B_150601_E10]|uniref:glycosyltransferase family 2 protein n=1 Tax=Paenibacillus sp. 1001270B_150601_E10 TaxID=2787079 RepID=UPI0018A04677|nr:glycosyltransferase [Paenibacillus sp. 1001270B_150601_E10]
MTSSLFTMVILVMNQIGMTRQCIRHVRACQSQHIPILIIDNGSDPEHVEELKSLGDGYIRNEQNVGVIPAMNQAWPLIQTPYVMYMHNDVFLWEPNFDRKITAVLTEVPYVGVAGFGGGSMVNCHGSRNFFTSNMLDAEVHGTRMKDTFVPSVSLDGLCLIIRKELLVKFKGIATEYTYHHYYDMDICLASIYAGYKVVAINVYHQHSGSMTSKRADYVKWLSDRGMTDMELYLYNRNIFYAKWGRKSWVLVDEKDFIYQDAEGLIPMKG